MFNSTILKLTSTCNLNCTYCYMFNLEDRTHERVPNFLCASTACTVIRRIVEHLDCTGIRPYTIILHGGEPMLWPRSRFKVFFAELAYWRSKGYPIECSLQTNGYRAIEPDMRHMLADADVTLGISLDGPRTFNDRFRITVAGQGSYDRVVENIHDILASDTPSLVGGFLSVALPDIKPEIYLGWLCNLPITKADVLWPIQFNHDRPPWADSVSEMQYADKPVYGKWFAELFKLWLEYDDPTVEIRQFSYAIRLWLGDHEHPDYLVNDTVDMFVVNTDGAVEYPDYLRASSDGAAKTRFNIQDTPISELATDDTFKTLLSLHMHLPEECHDCQYKSICGGGFLPGRMNQNTLLTEKRSVLCHDQWYFFNAVNSLMSERMARPSQRSLPPIAIAPVREESTLCNMST